MQGKLLWEDDCWIASMDGEGFSVVLNSESFDVLVERVKVAVQDILEVDFSYSGDIRFNFQAERVDDIRIRAS